MEKQDLRIENLYNWRDTKLNIGLLAEPDDKLKQLFIDKLTGFDYLSQLRQVEETKCYKHLYNENFSVWDLNINCEIDFSKFDFFILFREDGFLESDYKLAKEIESKGKKVYFVSANLPSLEQQESIKGLSAKELVDRIKNEIKQKYSEDNVYIMSQEDFPKLNEDIIKNLSEDKMKAFVLTVEPLSKEIVEKKKEILESRTSNVSVLSSLFGSLFTLPTMAIIADIALLSTEIWFYRKQLGLTEEKLKYLPKKVYDKITKIIEKSKYGSYVVLNDMHSITGLLLRTLPMLVISDMSDLLKFVPLIGAVLHGTVSTATTKYALLQIIDEFSKIALDIQSIVSDQKMISALSSTEQPIQTASAITTQQSVITNQ